MRIQVLPAPAKARERKEPCRILTLFLSQTTSTQCAHNPHPHPVHDFPFSVSFCSVVSRKEEFRIAHLVPCSHLHKEFYRAHEDTETGRSLSWECACFQFVIYWLPLTSRTCSHCATHQIRVILISGVVITSLFYPALALYFNSSHAASLSNLDAVQSAFFSKSRFRIHQDLDDLWTGYDNLRVCENAVCRARCGTGHVVRVERVLVQSALLQDEGALNRQILTSSLHLEQAIEDALTASQVPCLKALNGQCLILSPLAFWNHEEKLLIQDKDALGTLASSQNVTLSGLPITPRMVLAGRESNDPHVGGETFDFASYLALTFFFPESECDGKMGRAQWLRILRSAVGDGAELLIQRDEPSLIALQVCRQNGAFSVLSSNARFQYASITPKWTVFSAFVYLAYTAFFAYVIWCVRSMDAVHSRIGLTFTALAEIASSTITSLSVCALVGFKVTMVPW